MKKITKKGRNKKYPSNDKRDEARKLQNRINQRNCRLKKRTILSIGKKSNTKQDYLSYFNLYDFNYYLVGTIRNEKSSNLHSLRKYTTQYINHFLSEEKIDRCLLTFEGGNSHQIHTNILINSTHNLENTDELIHKWLKGGMNINCIETEVDKENLISYIFKEVDFDPKNKNDLDKLDYWNVFGYWNM